MTTRRFNGLAAVAISVVTLLVYRGLFGLWFTDVDTFPLIATGRIDSVGAAVDVITSPLMQGLMPNALFYRPMASLSWGVDELVWGLNPLGYHLTDLAFHIANSLLLFSLLRDTARGLSASEAADKPRIAQGDLAALAGALIFALHPIAMETVPAIARRPDLLYGLFLLLMLQRLGKGLRKPRGLDIGVAALYCGLGLASKDSAIVLPAIAIAFVFCFSSAATFATRAIQCLRLCWPLLLATLLFEAVRTAVLGGFGGYAWAAEGSFALSASGSFEVYLCALFFSGDLDACPDASRNGLIGAVAVLAASLAWFCWRASRASRHAATDELDPAVRFFAFAILSLAAILGLHIAVRTPAALRTLYTSLLFLGTATGWGAVIAVRGALALGRPHSGRIAERALHAVASVLLIAVIGGVLRGAWSGRYIEEWRASSEVARLALADLTQHIESVPRDSVVYLVNFPFWVGRHRQVLRERPILLEHSVQGFVDLAFPDRGIEVVGLSYLVISLDDPATLASRVRFHPDRARLDIFTAREAYATPFPWNNQYGKRSPSHSNTYFEKKGERGLVVVLNPEAEIEGRAVFLVYVGDHVERRGTGPWVAEHRPPGGTPPAP